MTSASGGSLVKAVFTPLEGGSEFTVQYNPKEFKVDKQVSWKEHDDQGQDKAYLEFQKGSPMTVNMDLLFDTTVDGSDVRTAWVNGLLSLTNADVSPSDGEASELGKKRPTRINFTWGNFSLECVIESVSTTYLMFSSDGTPLRAKCSVKLKEWSAGSFSSASGGKRWEGNTIRLVEGKAGDTAVTLGNQYNVDPRQIGEDNNLSDLNGSLAGQNVVVRVG